MGSDTSGHAGPENTVEVTADGPLRVTGDLRLRHADDRAAVTSHAELVLCRCGRSQTKPLCDGSHAAAGFCDPGRAVGASVATPGGGEPLHIITSPDGPLVLLGPMVIRGADGSLIRRERAALCRCGVSACKPLCDGSHGGAGFVADDQIAPRGRRR